MELPKELNKLIKTYKSSRADTKYSYTLNEEGNREIGIARYGEYHGLSR